MKQGFPESIEFEYKRHGTLCLTPSFNILTGKIDYHTIAETRDENDFADHIKNTVALAADASWIFVSDQLNTHKSESLVRFISEACELKDDLGVKGKSGILQSMDSRMEFLSNEAHRIRFVYTPKHCSWLNQVEIWFGILSRKLLKRGSFKSKDELQNKMNNFIEYFNERLAKPSSRKTVCIIDGQGGGIGSTIIKKIKDLFGESVEIIALGTNAIATAQMLKARANRGASGENAIVQTVARVDVVVGTLGILLAHAMMGEVTPKMAEAVSGCAATKLILPLSQENVHLVGLSDDPLPHLVEILVIDHLKPLIS